MIKPESIASAGGDWGQYGEVVGQQLIALMQTNKISVVFANDGLIVAVERADGSIGEYNLKHVTSF